MTRIWQHNAGTKGQRRREVILREAAALFTTKGYSLTTTQDIADRAGIAKGSLYYYFNSKEELLFSILLQNQEQLHRSVIDGHDFASTGELADVRVFLSRHVQFVLTHNAVSALFGQEAGVVRAVDSWWNTLSAARRVHEDLLVAIIRRAQASGQANDHLDASLTARALLAMANSTLQWYRHEGRYGPDDVAAHHAELAVSALRP
jgi:AcrR family transcriptional regulator